MNIHNLITIPVQQHIFLQGVTHNWINTVASVQLTEHVKSDKSLKMNSYVAKNKLYNIIMDNFNTHFFT